MRVLVCAVLLTLTSCLGSPYTTRYFGPRGEPQSPPPKGSGVDILETLGPVLAGSVQVLALDEEGRGVSRGSGVCVGESKYLTARHIVEGAHSWVVKLGTRHVKASCAVRGEGPFDDWALLVGEGRLAEAVPVMGDRAPSPFSQAVAVGYGLGYPDPTVTVGHLQVVGETFIRFSAPITYGNSGGGLFAVIDGELRLIGITVAVGVGGGTAVEHMGIAAPLAAIRKQGGLK